MLDVVDRTETSYRRLCGFVALTCVGLLAYAVTLSFTWDEGFHLLAAQLILGGKRPYLDFFHAQAPLYGYWNAAWMLLFGQTWRTAHALSALTSAAATFLTADFVYTRFTGGWRLAGGLAAALLTGLNVMVVSYGTLGQAYGLCLFLSVAAFRVAILSVDRKTWLLAAASGFFAGASACASLLTAPVPAILFLWIAWQSKAEDRLRKILGFLAGAAIPFVPLAWFFVEAPDKVWFDVFKWHLVYRRVNWPEATQWDLDVTTSWLDSSHGFLLAILAVIGLIYLAKHDEWDSRERAEFYLSGGLAAGLGLYLSFTHPTFTRYFVVMVPFVSIPATVGFYALASSFGGKERPLKFVAVLAMLIVAGLSRFLYLDRDSVRWYQMESVARKVNEVTPPNEALWADEHIYFLTRRTPPSGMEFAYSHKISVPAKQAESLHLLSNEDVKRQLAAGAFATVESCEDSDENTKLGLPTRYRQMAKVDDCYVFWDRTPH
jgi:uncharacterized membrane protein